MIFSCLFHILFYLDHYLDFVHSTWFSHRCWKSSWHCGARPPRHICTISSSSTLTLMEPSCDGHVPLMDVVQLLVELKLSCNCVGRENLSNILPGFLRCLGFSNVAEHVVMNTCRQAIHYSTHRLLPCWVVGVLWVGLIFLSSFDVAPITLADKVFVHLSWLRAMWRHYDSDEPVLERRRRTQHTRMG